jgi:hypothetical protein
VDAVKHNACQYSKTYKSFKELQHSMFYFGIQWKSTLFMNIPYSTATWKQENQHDRNMRVKGKMNTGARVCERKVNKEYFEM